MHLFTSLQQRPVYQIAQRQGLLSDDKRGGISGPMVFPRPPRKGLIATGEGTMSFSKE